VTLLLLVVVVEEVARLLALFVERQQFLENTIMAVMMRSHVHADLFRATLATAVPSVVIVVHFGLDFEVHHFLFVDLCLAELVLADGEHGIVGKSDRQEL